MSSLRKMLLGLALFAITVIGAGSAQAQVSGCPIGSTQIIGCYKVDGTTITVNSGTISAIGAAASSIQVGVTTVSGGTSPFLLYNNAGVLGNESLASLLVSPPAIGGTTPAPGNFTTLGATGNLTTNVTGGGTQCLQASNAGIVSGTGSACGSGGSGITGITVGTTTISGGAANGLLYQNVSGSTVNEVTTANNQVLGTNGSGVPAYTGTLPSGVTASSLTSVGTLTGGATGAGFTVALSTSTITGTLTGTNGGTGVNNGANTITVGGNFSTGGTLTFANLNVANELAFTSSANNVGLITTANNEVLGTNGSGIPAWTTTLPSAVTASSLTSLGTLTSLSVSGTITSNITGGGTVCVQANNTGVLSGTGSACGSGGTGITGITINTTTISGGTTTQLLYDNAGTVGNETFAAACTNATSAAFGCVKVDGTTITAVAGIITAQADDYLSIANAASTGTTVNKLAKLTGAPSTAVITATTDPPNAVAIGIVTAGAGTTGNATIQYNGLASCVFDGVTTAGDIVELSTTTAGDCHDAGANPGAGQIIGTVLSTNASGGTYQLALNIMPSIAIAPITCAAGQFINSLPSSGTPTCLGVQITVGTTTISGGTTNDLLYDNGGLLGSLATANNEVLGTNGSGVPAWTTTLPSAVTASSLTSVGTLTSLTISGSLTTNITGSTECVQANSSGVLSGTGSTCGSGGTGITGITIGTTTISGGTNPDLLYDNNGVVGNETFATACTAATAAALGCVEVDNLTTTASAGGSLSSEGANYYIPNAGATGTTTNKLAKLTGAPSTAVITATGDATSSAGLAIGIVTAGAGTSGTATIQHDGIVTCVFDGATTAGHPVQISSTTAGDCHDNGTATPSAGQVIGTVLGTIGAAGNAPVAINIPQSAATVLLNATGQNFTGGIHPQAFSNGIATSGTKTIDCGNGPIQTLANNGAFTLAMSANDGTCVVRINNQGSAGTITFSGFSEGSNTGDSLTTAANALFDISLTRINGSPHYLISALQ